MAARSTPRTSKTNGSATALEPILPAGAGRRNDRRRQRKSDEDRGGQLNRKRRRSRSHDSNFDFPKRLRLLKPRDFERVMQARVSATDGLLRMYGAANDFDHPRLGLTVSRRVGGATTRNVWKRALREAFRLAQHELPACDLVCIPHRDADAGRRPARSSRCTKLARRIDAELRRRSAR